MTADVQAVELVERIAGGDARALARAISLVEDGAGEAAAVVRACAASVAKASVRRSRRIGITGSPGVGKSTLVDALIRELRGRGERVGVMAVDPTSPYTGGALLGDRIRMQGFAEDAGVSIRSLASRRAPGGVTRTTAAVCGLMEAAGFGTILIETVGVGQDEVRVAEIAEATVLVLVPGLGDDVQSLKAGIMEAADLFVVNKADLPGAERVEAEIRGMQGLACAEDGAWMPPVLRVVATAGEGVPELMEAIERYLALKAKRPRDWKLPEAGARIDHLGMAVRSIDTARSFYALLGLAVEAEEEIAHEGVRTAMLQVGESRIELLEPTAADSTIDRFLSKRGEGLHHVALRVGNLDERFRQLQAAGVRLVSQEIRTGAGGHRYFFVHPASTGGVLLELVGSPDPEP